MERKWNYELISRCFEGILDNTNLKKFGTLHEFAWRENLKNNKGYKKKKTD